MALRNLRSWDLSAKKLSLKMRRGNGLPRKLKRSTVRVLQSR